MGKVTLQEEADFVISMIDRDLSTIEGKTLRLEYLKRIAKKILDFGEAIAESPEDQKDDTIELLDSIGTRSPLIAAIQEIMREEYNERFGVDAVTPLEFLSESKCLRNDDAHEWLKLKGHDPQGHDHIHVYQDKWFCKVRDTDDLLPHATWIKDSGEAVMGDIMIVTRELFTQAYLPSLKERS